MILSAVVPCYRSEETLPLLVPQLNEELHKMVKASSITDFEIILVVDGSPDNTAETAHELDGQFASVKVIELQRNFGQHAASIAGIRAAKGEITVTLDDDLQHLPSQIELLIAPIITGRADLVYARPEKEEHGWARSFSSRTVKRALEISGVENASWIGSFRAFRTSLREGFQKVSDPSVNLDVLLSWTTTSVSPVIVHMPFRSIGNSTYSPKRLFNYALNMITGYGIGPLRVASLSGILASLVGLMFLAVALWNYFVVHEEIEGFTTIVALICIFSGTQLITLGIIGEYLGRVHLRTMNKPIYIIKPTESH